MVLLRNLLITCIAFVSFCQTALALQIVSPTEGEVFYAGSEINLIVKPDIGEEWEYVNYSMSILSYNTSSNEYRTKLRIPADFVGYEKLSVIGLDKFGKETEVIRNILVKLPPNVVLRSILINKDFMLLYKLPAGSPPENMQRIESRRLTVKGIYSDGVKRDITVSASGTTYSSSNDRIVRVSPDGEVTAQALGEAKITVKNGNYSAQVDVVVKPHRQPER